MTSATKATKAARTAKKGEAEVVRSYGPFGEGGVHGVTFDGTLVWFARDNELVAFDPESGEVKRRLDVPTAAAGTAFDGENLYQLAQSEILVVRPADGKVLRRIPAPKGGGNSGMAYADGYLWVGQFRASKIHQVDVKTGEVVKTITSDRFVTGVSCVGGALWHGALESEKPAELRRLARDGFVEETLTVKDTQHISGIEANGKGDFWCGGSAAPHKGCVLLVRPR